MIGCAIGEFGTLAYYSYSGIASDVLMYSSMWYFFAALPITNGLITSVLLETIILIKEDFDFTSALKTALGKLKLSEGKQSEG